MSDSPKFSQIAHPLPVDPDRSLALLHAPPAARPSLAAVFVLDEALADVLRGTSEPMIGLMRLAWWRESLQADETRPRAQPVLRALAAHAPGRGEALAAMIDGWEALLETPLTATEIAEHGAARGGTLFTVAADLLGPADGRGVQAAGEGWALVDLAFHLSDIGFAETALAMARDRLTGAPTRWPRRLRTLGALTALARRDAAAGGGRPRHLGGPGRAMTMLGVRLTGRG